MKKNGFLMLEMFAICALFLGGCVSMPGSDLGNLKPQVEVLEIQNGDCTIFGKIHVPAGAEGAGDGTAEKKPVIIMCHGYNGTYNDFFDDCDFYAKNGYIAYSFDFCGGSVYSQSAGRKTTEMTVFTEKSDVIAVYNYFAARDDVDAQRIYIFGGSQGGLAATLVCEELGSGKVRALALYYPAYCIPDNWRDTYKNEADIPEVNVFWGMPLGKEFFTSIRDFYTFDSIGSFENPVLIVHGTDDVIVPLSYSQKAVKKFASAKLITLMGEGHGFSPAQGEVARDYVLKFLKKN